MSRRRPVALEILQDTVDLLDCFQVDLDREDSRLPGSMHHAGTIVFVERLVTETFMMHRQAAQSFSLRPSRNEGQ